MPDDDPNSDIHISTFFWKAVAFWSATVAFICYPMSSSFRAVFGELTFSKFVLYYQVPFILISIIVMVNQSRYAKTFWYTTNLGFLVLILTSLYTVFEDKGSAKEEDELGKIMNLVSSAALTLMSMSLSRLMQLQYEVGLSSFFLGCFLVQLIKLKNVVALVGGAIWGCILVFLRHFSSPSLHASMVSFVNGFCDLCGGFVEGLQALVLVCYFVSDYVLSHYIKRYGYETPKGW